MPRARFRSFLTSAAIRSAVAAGIVTVLVLNVGGSGINGLPAARHSGDPHVASAKPGQRWGAASGQDHLSGRPGNHTVPKSLRGQYPLHALDQRPQPGHNTAAVVTPPETKAAGFDEATSREQPAARDRFARVYTNQDGTQTTEFSTEPQNFQRPDGSWTPIDTRLVDAATGAGWHNAADAVDVRLAARADAAELARFEVDAGHRMAFGLDGAAAVTGRMAQSAVTYPNVRPGVDLRLESRPGAVKETLVLRSADTPRTFLFPLRLAGLTARVEGRQVVLADAAGTTRATIPPGYMADAGSAEAAPATSTGVTYRIVDSAGGPALRVTLDAKWLADSARRFPVEVDATVSLPVDAAGADSSMYVRGGTSTSGNTQLLVGGRKDESNAASYVKFKGLVDRLTNHTIFGAALQVANYDAPSCKARPVTVHPVTSSWSVGSAEPTVGAALASKSFAHGYIALGQSQSSCPAAPDLIDLGSGGQKLVQRWVNGEQANNGLSLRASGSDSLAWKAFAGSGTPNGPRLYVTHSPYNATYSIPKPIPDPPVLQNQAGKVQVAVKNLSAEAWQPGSYYLAYRAYRADTGAAVTQQRAADLPNAVARGAQVTLDATIAPLPPGQYFLDFTMVRTGGVVFTDHQVPPGRIVLEVFDIPPVLQELYPPNGYQAPTLTPQLWATALDTDAPPGSTLQYKFEVCDRTEAGDPTGCTNSGYQAKTAWTVPAGRLSWSKTYLWRAFVKDANNEVPSPYSALLAAVPQPEVTSRIAGAPYGSQDKEFDAQVGNFSTAAVDATVATVGPELNVLRTYNSLDPRRDSAFGAGWISRYDMRLAPDNDGSGNVVVTYPDGQTVRFGRNPDGTFAAPQGRTASLTLTTSSYKLLDKSGTTYEFGLPSTVSPGPLRKITDSAGRSVVMAYDVFSGRLARAQVANSLTNTAGRALFFTWTGNHVTGVRTDPVGGAALAWTYTYDGDKLTKVCGPDTACTTYDYGTGSHYRTAVLDSRPESYWRLGEASGTAAGSEVAVNLGKDAGVYKNVTPGTAGALAGTGNSAATFNGTSSYVELPKGTVKKSRDGAVELWFKVNQTGQGGPLLGYQDKAIGTAAGVAVPVLYVGLDGKLHGQFATGAVAPIASQAVVNDGNWHQAVLSSMGSTQTLYLDGVKAGELTGTIDHTALSFNQIGAASATPAASWPGWGATAQRYFNGAIDEASIYSSPLGSAAVAAHYQLGRTAADQVTKVTLPTGRVAAETTYDAALDRITGYTDRNGGTWKIGAPTVYGGDTDLRKGVQVLDPANRASLYEYDALAGRMLRSGTPMGIETREEDKPGWPPPTPTPAPSQTVCTAPDPRDPGFCTIIPGGSGGPVFIPVSSESMGIRSYSYDDRGFQNKITDENGDTVEMGYDARGNVTSKKTCRLTTECHTTYYKFRDAVTNPFDPGNDLPLESRDGRSASATDNTYRTTYSYNTFGQLLTQGNPDGSVVSNLYTVGAESAIGGGNPPAGMPLSTTDPRQKVTRYQYFANGDLYRITEPNGLITEFGYDALGRKTSEKSISDTYPSGVITTYAYNTAGRVSTVTAPATTDAVSGVRHQAQTVNEYDADGNLVRATVKDLLGGDPERAASTEYDESGRPVVQTDPEGNETRYGYDRFGNQTFMQDPNGNRYEYAYTARNMIGEVRLRNWTGDPAGAPDPGDYLVLHSYSYDFAGRLASDTDAMGRRLEYLYYGDGLLRRITLKKFHNPDGSTRDYVVEENTYDGAGNLTKKVGGNGRMTVQNTVDATGKVTRTVDDPGGLNRASDYQFDGAGNVIRVTRSGNWSNPAGSFIPITQDAVDYAYDDAGNTIRETVTSGSTSLVTTYGYDKRSLLTSVTDPRGNATGADKAAYTTTFVNDELGQRIRAIAPPVATERDGGAPQTATPTTVAGYNTFGEQVASADELGNVTHAEYDKLGRQTAAVAPSYLTPGGVAITPTSRTRYDGLGNVVETTDPGGAQTRYGYDQLNRMLTRDEPATSNDERAVWRYTYTRTGEVLSVTDPNGARVESTYDDLDRQVTMTEVERRPVTDNFTSRMGYDDAGNVTSMTAPSGATTLNVYDGVGALIKSTDPNGVLTQYGYDYAGRQVRLSDGLGRTTRSNYDGLGHQTSEQDLTANQTVLRTQSYGYDLAGNVISSTDPLNRTTTYAYDARNQLIRQVEPTTASTSITTTFGYDAAGNRTRYTDGRGNSTIYTVNALGLPESVIEPATTAYPSTADRTWKVGYDADANPVRLDAPGNVLRQRSYDAAGRLTGETGSGAAVTTTARTLGYDLTGRLTSASAPGGTNRYTYNDRGALLNATGPSGAASFGYNSDGLVTSRSDAAGTASFTYDRGRLATMTDAVTATTQTLGYDAAGQPATVNYGAGRVRTYGYDDLGRLDSDTLRNAAGQVVASTGYGFDLDDRITRKTTAGTAGAGDNTYEYDYAGRLTSWTSPAGTVGYGWDDSGNRIRAGAKTAAYDQRNRLLSDGTYTYGYTARGTLSSRSGSASTENYSFDAFDRLVSSAGQNYTYDGLNRAASRNGATFAYAGLSDELISDGVELYARGAADELLAVAQGGTKRLALTDAHGDVVAAFDPTSATLPALSDSTAYDPFGQKLASAGDTGNVGFQGDWTDPATGQVDMGARWYDPGTGSFTSRDSATYSTGDSILANRYTYGAGDPLDFSDPDGHWPKWLKKAAKAVGGAISSAASTVYHGVTAAASWAWSGIKAVGSAIASAASWVYNKAKQAVSWAVDKIKDGINWVKDKARAALDWAKQKAEQARRAAVERARQVTAAAKKAVVYAVQHNPLPAIAAAMKPLLTGLSKIVSSAANLAATVVSEVRDVVEDAAASVKQIYDKAVEAAGNVVETVSKAVESAANATMDWAVAHADIVGLVVGVVVGVGCTALTGGAGAVLCGAIGGGLSALVEGALQCKGGDKSHCGMGLVRDVAAGVVLGGIGGGVGAVLGGGLSAAGSGVMRSGLSGAVRGFGAGARAEAVKLFPDVGVAARTFAPKAFGRFASSSAAGFKAKFADLLESSGNIRGVRQAVAGLRQAGGIAKDIGLGALSVKDGIAPIAVGAYMPGSWDDLSEAGETRTLKPDWKDMIGPALGGGGFS